MAGGALGSPPPPASWESGGGQDYLTDNGDIGPVIGADDER
jgi:hypothetical protein